MAHIVPNGPATKAYVDGVVSSTQATASSASTDAATALSNAASAQSTASTASTAATSAQNTANSAQTAANNAQTTANNALGTLVVLGADQANSTTTIANVTGWTWSSLAAGTYTLDVSCIFTSAATTTGMKFGMVFPAQAAVSYNITVPSSGAGASNVYAGTSAGYASPTSVGVAGNQYLATIKAVITVTGTLASAIAVQFASSTASTAVTIKTGSVARLARVA